MNALPENVSDDTWDIGELVLILLRRWWIIAAVLVASLAVVFALWLARDEAKPLYDATTSVLVVKPIAATITGSPDPDDPQEIKVIVPDLSVQTLQGLASARDLLQIIINDLGLVDGAGAPISVETLGSWITTVVGSADSKGDLPLINTTVRGEDPALVQRVAAAWAEQFAIKNGEFVVLVAAGSYDRAVAQLDSATSKLDAALDSRQEYERVQSAEVLSLSDKAGLDQNALEDSRDLEVLSLKLADGADRLALESTRAQLALDPQIYPPIAANMALLSANVSTYDNSLTTLETNKSSLVHERARLEKLTEALAAENEITVLERDIPNDVLVTILSGDPTAEQIAAIDELTLTTEEINALYGVLKEEVITSSNLIFSVEQENAFLLTEIDRLSLGITDLSSDLERDKATRDAFDRTTDHLLSAFDREAASEIRQHDFETSSLARQLAKIADQSITDLTDETLLELARMDRQIESLTKEADRRQDEVEIAESASTDGAGSIRLVESAVVPSHPIPVAEPANLQRSLSIGAIIGLILGSTLALIVYWSQRALARRKSLV